MLTTLGIIIAVLIIGLLVFASTKPDVFRVQRELVMQAPPDKIFAILNDFRQWSVWSPWENKDPAMKRTYGTISAGKGAHYAWEGNKNVGIGSMTMDDTVPPSKLVIKLDFLKPFEAHNIVEFTLGAEGAGTRVVWSMHGPSNFMSKLMQVFMDMDKMCGKDFEAGLANLKAAVEK